MFMVPTSSPGFKLTPLPTMGDVTTNATYYEDVRVPASAMVGPENGGWWLIVGQLNHERVSLIPLGPTQRFYEEVRDWARATRLPDGRRVVDQPWVQHNLARVKAGVEVLKLLNWRQAWNMTRGEMNYAEASTVKVFGSEFYVEAYRLLLEVLGQAGYVKRDSPAAILQGTARAHVSRHAHHDLRRRHQRGAARDHRDGRARPAAIAIEDGADGLLLHSRAGGAARSRAQHLPGPRDPRAPEGRRGASRTSSTASSGARSPRRICWASRSPRRTAAAGSA